MADNYCMPSDWTKADPPARGGLTYEQSGVSIEAQDSAIAAFKAAVEATHGPEVVAGVGAFGAAFAPNLAGIADPVLVSSTDSLGSKTLLHARFGTYEAAGRDVVGCVSNDVICSGARPLFFLDYLGISKVEPEHVRQIVSGVAMACGSIGTALIGGEIAELPDIYKPGDFDLAGFCVGLVDRSTMLGAHRVRAGSVLIGLASSGVHCNGFSLVRKALGSWSDSRLAEPLSSLAGQSLREQLLCPTLCYAHAVRDAGQREVLQAAAHISGGGLIDNVPRVIPAGLCAVVNRSKVRVPTLFAIIQQEGQVADDEMWHVFNMGVGFVLIVAPDAERQVLDLLNRHSEEAFVIGAVEENSSARFRWS
jgi:phosphoribosylformylglycinamidine cyclo-ligase